MLPPLVLVLSKQSDFKTHKKCGGASEMSWSNTVCMMNLNRNGMNHLTGSRQNAKTQIHLAINRRDAVYNSPVDYYSNFALLVTNPKHVVLCKRLKLSSKQLL